MAHQHIIGQSGTGKTSLLRELILQDTNPGVCIFDTTGDLTEHIPHDFLFDPSITRWNPLAEPVNPNLAPTFFAEAMKDAYGYDDLTTPVMSMYLSFLAAAIIENKRNVTNAPDFLTDKAFRTTYSYNNSLVHKFWDNFEKMSDKDKRQDIASTLNKFLTLLLDGRVHRMFSSNRPKLSLSDVSDKVMVVRLPVSEYGKETVSLIGSLVLAYLYQLTDSDYSIYIEDADLFAKGVLKEMLVRGRIDLTLSHQYMDQLDQTLAAAVLGNCAKRYVFRVAKLDADLFLPDSGTSYGPPLDALPNFTYRTAPYDGTQSKITIPLEN